MFNVNLGGMALHHKLQGAEKQAWKMFVVATVPQLQAGPQTSRVTRVQECFQDKGLATAARQCLHAGSLSACL